MNEGSADSPRAIHIVRIAGIDVTPLPTGAIQFRCETHGALVTASLNPRKPGGWAWSASCKICDLATLQPILDAIQAALINGNSNGARPDPRPASESDLERERSTGPTLDTWLLVIHDRARAEIDKTFRRHGALAAEMLRTAPIETFIATVNAQRNLPNDNLTHDPDGLTPIEL
jgi:hypothetical protein